MTITDRSYIKGEVASFFRTSETFGAFSNMHAGFPFRIASCDVYSTEALYQALRFPHLPDFQKEIINQEKPVPAKRHSYKRVTDTRPDWFEQNFNIMRYVLEIKCAFYPEEMRVLFAKTAGKSIVEISSRDDFWGTFEKDGLLQGKNVLGRLWMERREIHLEHPADEPIEVDRPSFPDAILCGQTITSFTPEPVKDTQAGFSF